MKTPFYFFLCIAMMMAFNSFSQNAASISAVNQPDTWRPVKMQDNGKNELKGVEFYRKPADCNSQRFVLFKIVNLNKYPVKIQWHDNTAAQKSVVIPASSEVEGNCTPGKHQKDLMIPKAQLEKEKNNKETFLSHLEITEEKN